MKKVLHILFTVVATVLLLALMAVWVTSVSPVYSFRAPRPFQGPDIFNPYSSLDTVQGWKRANFHTHTRVKGPFPPNECEAWPQETYDTYEKLGYEIVTFSNHNELTVHPFDSTLQVNVYEQGYSPFKFHKLVFGSKDVIHWDPLLPLLASQKQFQLNYLGKSSDFIQINHPYRTIGLSKAHMEALSGYELMELDTHISTQNEYWDQALSAGHYSFGLANDDLHHARNPHLIAIRCNFLCTPSARYEDLKHTLLTGCYYAMRVPDYGNGDWDIKREKNHQLPAIRQIGVAGDTIRMTLTQKADSIRINGQNHATLKLAQNTDSISYVLQAEEPYARLTAYFPGGEVIYTNPFARYDASAQESPMNNAPQKVNVLLTVLFNLLLLALIAGTVYLLVKLYRRK
ncbi:MAG: hypothetical protein IJQ96_07070 [Bacteroidales bacterium]|nr:hypothetical protein [Bacteroidales bacterium]